MSEVSESYEEHVLQNNNRLLSIGQSMRDQTLFSSACAELTQWCSDPRAYTSHFEENLLNTLQICVENGTKEGYDFTLAHQLITCCFQHRKLLSKESAVRINRWYEQYRRIKKNGGKRKRKTEMPPVDPGGFEQIVVTDSGSTSSMWPQGGPMAGATPMQSPGYQPMMPMHGAYPGMQPSPFPMDPTGARPQYPGDPTGYEMAMMQQQRMIAMQNQQMAMQHQQRRRAAAAAAPTGYDMAMYNNIPMGANSVPGQSQPLLRMPSQPGMASPAYTGMMAGGRQQQQHQPMASPAYPQGNPQMIRAGPPMLFGQLQQNTQHQQVMSYPNPHATPGSGMPSFSNEPIQYLMIPQNAIPLPPFAIPSEMMNFSTTFDVSPELYQQLSNIQQLNLQLKSYGQMDPTFRTSWPTKDNEMAIQIGVNGQQLHTTKDKSILIKQCVKMGTNTLDMCLSQPGTKHLYILQVVSIVPTARVTEDLFTQQQKRGFNSELCKQKLMQKAAVCGGSVSISFMDPKYGRKMKVPARSIRCDHATCFELQTTLQDQFECARLSCPVPGCSAVFGVNEIEIDEFVGSALRESTMRNPPATEMVVEAVGTYRLVDVAEPSTSRKRGADDSGSFPMKRIKSEQFPMPPSSSSPFPMVNSLPTALGQSPMMSPFAAHISPKKEIPSPAPAKVNGGPATPHVKEEPPQTTATGPQLSSPHPMPIQQHGSVEAPSLTGSAPYTPASMNGLPHPTAQDQTTLTQHNASFSSLDIEDFVINTAEMSADDIRRYLLDSDHMCVKESKVNDHDLWNEDTLRDIREVISADMAKTALNA